MTTEPLRAVVLPTPDEVEDHAKALAAVLAIVATAWALVTRWHRARQRDRETRRLEGKAIRYALDAVRYTLHALQPFAIDWEKRDELARQLTLVSEVREELWIADGNDSRREAERLESEIVRVLTRTQRIKALPAKQSQETSE